MKKIKKYSILILFMITIMFIPNFVQGTDYGLITNSIANKIFNGTIKTGDRVKLGFEQRKHVDGLLCMQHGVDAPSNSNPKYYTVNSGITIEGNTATKIGSSKTTTNIENGVLAYILSSRI